MQKGEKEKVPETEIFREVRGVTEMSRSPTMSQCWAVVINAAVGSIHKCVLNSEFRRVLKWTRLVPSGSATYSG